MEESPSLIVTADGSHSLLSTQYQVSYHSRHGAIQETGHVFIEAGLLFQFTAKKPIKILELGFGSGLNALMTFLKAKEIGIPVAYTTLERYPISWQLANQFNYLSLLHAVESSEVFQKMHTSPFKTWLSFDDGTFRFRKLKEDLLRFNSSDLFTLVYYDAFAPETQPELWTEAVFRQIYNMMESEGILVTYCAKGSVKRALKAAGFIIEAIPGPPGKREMTRALKRSKNRFY